MFLDSLGQEFRESTAEVACLLHNFWHLNLLLAGTSAQLSTQIPTCGLVVASSRCGSWVPSIPTGQGRSAWHCSDLVLKVTHSHFCYTLLVKFVAEFCPDSRGRDIDLIIWWEGCQGHSEIRTCRMSAICGVQLWKRCFPLLWIFSFLRRSILILPPVVSSQCGVLSWKGFLAESDSKVLQGQPAPDHALGPHWLLDWAVSATVIELVCNTLQWIPVGYLGVLLFSGPSETSLLLSFLLHRCRYCASF